MSGVLEMFGPEELATELPAEGLPEDPRERFAELVRRRDALEVPSSVLAQDALEEELLEEIRTRLPRKKPKVPAPREAGRWTKIKSLCEPFAEHRDEVIERHVDTHARARDEVEDRRKEIDAELGRLAAQLEVRPGACFTRVAEVSCHEFSTQPQSSWYAQGRAELRACAFLKLGIDVVVREVVTQRTHAGRVRDWFVYEVWAQVDPLDLEVLQQRFEDSLPEGEWLQACHDRALNPRVYRPFLPWEMEDEYKVRRGGRIALGDEVPTVRVRRAEVV